MTKGKFERVTLIIMDGVGIGYLPDAYRWGDEGSNTLVNTARAVGGLELPNLQRLGLGNIDRIEGVPPVSHPEAAYGKMAEVSAGKDSTVGHWEITGVVTDKAFPTYPDGFPPEIIEEFERRTGRKAIGNIPISGTEIIDRLGEQHMETGDLIVYTSADSVFQIAAHTGVVPLKELYRYSEIARVIMQGEHEVSRVIARPFIGTPGAFKRTADRKDFSVPPPKDTLLDHLVKAGLPVITVGKVDYLYDGRGVTRAVHVQNNMMGVDKTIEAIQSIESGLVFTNLSDFDVVYGHRNNPEGFTSALKDLDGRIPDLKAALGDKDVLVITADHGNDPTTPSTDHSREYVPVLVWGNGIRSGVDLGTRKSFADLGATLGEMLLGESIGDGSSFLKAISQ